MKKTPIILAFSILLFCGCTKFECPEFNDSSLISEYNCFKGNLNEYNYWTSDSTIFKLRMIAFEKSQYEEIRCSQCMCNPTLKADYVLDSLDIHFSSTLSHGWRNENIESTGDLYLEINENQYIFKPSGNSIIEQEIDDYYQRKFTRTTHDSLKLVFQTFKDVTQFDLKAPLNEEVHSVWYTKKSGIIGFKVGATIFETK